MKISKHFLTIVCEEVLSVPTFEMSGWTDARLKHTETALNKLSMHC